MKSGFFPTSNFHQWGLSAGNVFVFVNGISIGISLMNIKCRLNEIVYNDNSLSE